MITIHTYKDRDLNIDNDNVQLIRFLEADVRSVLPSCSRHPAKCLAHGQASGSLWKWRKGHHSTAMCFHQSARVKMPRILRRTASRQSSTPRTLPSRLSGWQAANSRSSLTEHRELSRAEWWAHLVGDSSSLRVLLGTTPLCKSNNNKLSLRVFICFCTKSDCRGVRLPDECLTGQDDDQQPQICPPLGQFPRQGAEPQAVPVSLGAEETQRWETKSRPKTCDLKPGPGEKVFHRATAHLFLKNNLFVF